MKKHIKRIKSIKLLENKNCMKVMDIEVNLENQHV